MEASCSVCLEYLKDPVMIDCGHNFCRVCITRWWEELNRDFPCPVCRKTFRYRTLKPNRQLGNMVEIAKQLQVTNKRKVRDENLCEKHHEVLRLFCKDDQEAVCLVCEISHEHRSHTVISLDDASTEYKVGQILDSVFRMQPTRSGGVGRRCRRASRVIRVITVMCAFDEHTHTCLCLLIRPFLLALLQEQKSLHSKTGKRGIQEETSNKMSHPFPPSLIAS